MAIFVIVLSNILLNSFPHLFMSCHHLPKKGSMPISFTKHLLMQHDSRFETNTHLPMILWNQLQRHTGIRDMNVAISSRLGADFQILASQPDFREQLIHAIEHPSDADSKQFRKSIWPMLRAGGQNIPFGPFQKSKNIAHCYAMVHKHGMPLVFLTISPRDINNRINIRLSFPAAGASECSPGELRFNAQGLPDAGPRQEINIQINLMKYPDMILRMAQHPASAAMVYDRVVQSVFQMCGLQSVSGQSVKTLRPMLASRTKGIFGTPIEMFAATEAQARGSLHVHALLWVGLSPELVQSLIHRNDFARQISDTLDTMVKAYFPQIFHDAADMAKTKRCFRMDYRMAVSDRSALRKSPHQPQPYIGVAHDCPIPDIPPSDSYTVNSRCAGCNSSDTGK